MKRITIKKALENYDEKKGLGRTLLKEEPHIGELRAFYNELLEKKEKNLSPSSLLKLAHILIGKKTRTDESESGKTFEELVKGLGGYKALDALNAAHQLTEDNVVFLEKHPTEAESLASSIISITKNTSVPTMKNILNAAEQLNNPQDLSAFFKDLEIISRSENAYFFIKILSLLNKYGLKSDEVTSLFRLDNVISIASILDTLAETNSALITKPNLISILKIKKPYVFIDLYEHLPPNQSSLDSLFEANDTLEKCSWSADILLNFKNAGWDPQPYLKAILGGEINGWELKSAIEKLTKLKLKLDTLTFILQTMFSHSDNSTVILEAVIILNTLEGLDETHLKVAFKEPKFSKTVAAAFATLQQAKCFEKASQIYVCLYPEYALGLAEFWIQLSKIKHADLTLRRVMLSSPQSSSYAATVMDLLQEHKLDNPKNLWAVCNARLSSGALLSLLNVMSEAKILNQPNLSHLFPRLSFIKTLYSGARCLANVGKLDTFNFESLIADPINAVMLAKNLGGKAYKDNVNIKNPGAQNFVTIGNNIRTLCQVHRQGRFFQPVPAEKMESFEKHRGITVAQAQNEILIKIAGYSGNHSLEKEVEQHVAQDVFSSMKI